MSKLYQAPGETPPHDDALCGIDRESSCDSCRTVFWPGGAFWQRQALEAMADDEAMIEFRLPKRPKRFRGPTRADLILQMLSLAKTIIADPEFRGIIKFVFDTVLEGGDV